MYRRALGVLMIAALTGCTNLNLSNPSVEPSPHGAYNLEIPPSARSLENLKRTDLETVRVESGDTLTAILVRVGVPLESYHRLPVTAREDFADLHPGDKLAIGKNEDGSLLLLAKKLPGADWEMARYDRNGHPTLSRGELVVARLTLAWEGGITPTGELASTDEDPLPPGIKDKTIELLNTGLLPEGTQVKVIGEQAILGGRAAGEPSLLFAQATMGRGLSRLAMRYARSDGTVNFFDQEGAPLESEWVDHPIEGTPNITSGFDPHRVHPIYRRARPHNGVDYAAPTGTPVIAASRGVVTHAGWQGSWGQLITIRHDDGSETYYAHLSRIVSGLAVGTRVSAGERIGRVGTTGASTGPHLHFERRVAGRAVNPIADNGQLLAAAPLTAQERAGFAAERRRLLALIDGGNGDPAVAMNAGGGQ